MEEHKPEADPKIIRNAIGMEFVLIPAGRFKMGGGISPKEVVRRYGGEVEMFKDEHPQHDVTIGNPYYLQTTPVTRGKWKEVTGYSSSEFKDDDADCPFNEAKWGDVQYFIQKLNEMEGTDIHRLPTEAEWEYACRVGTTSEFSFGDDAGQLGEYAWFAGNSDRKTHPVGQKKPNNWGLYDMHGNVWEWVEDDWHENYEGAPDDGSAWTDESRGVRRVLRGGSWVNFGWSCRSANRLNTIPDLRNPSFGFRLAMSVSLGP